MTELRLLPHHAAPRTAHGPTGQSPLHHRQPSTRRAPLIPRQRTESSVGSVTTEVDAVQPFPVPERDERAEAFAEYVRAHRSTLLRSAAQVADRRTEPEDLLQEALVRTYGAWDRIEDTRAVGAYLRRTMANHQISQWRRQRVDEYACEDVPEVPADGDPLGSAEIRVVLRRAMARLSPRERTVLGLRYFQSYTDTEIAEELQLSVGTVKSSLWRALRKLRDDPTLDGAYQRLDRVAC
jgi:RNA polymerase sigma-70 factor (sigma-E family)